MSNSTPPPIAGSPVPPTQVRRPWRAVVRTVFQALVALATLIPLMVSEVYTDLEQAPAVVTQVVFVLGVVTRIMAMESVEQFLAQYLPFLAAEPKSSDYDLSRRNEYGYGGHSLLFIAGVVLVIMGLLFLVMLAVGEPVLDLVWVIVLLVVGAILAVVSHRNRF